MTSQQKSILKLIQQIINAAKELKEHPDLDIYDSQVFAQIYKQSQIITAKLTMKAEYQNTCKS